MSAVCKQQESYAGLLRLGALPRSSDYPRTQVQAEADYPNSGSSVNRLLYRYMLSLNIVKTSRATYVNRTV